jgi:hypothetical protein
MTQTEAKKKFVVEFQKIQPQAKLWQISILI